MDIFSSGRMAFSESSLLKTRLSCGLLAVLSTMTLVLVELKALANCANGVFTLLSL